MTAFEQLTIETPEQIALEFPLAGVGSRFLALAIDLLIQAVLVFVLFLLWIGLSLVAARFGLTGGIGGVSVSLDMWVGALALLAGFIVMYGYYALFEILWRGQTPGKRVLGLRVIAASGRPASAYQLILRNLLRIVDALPGPYAVGILSVMVTARSQRLGDLAAGTVVVHERSLRETHAVPNLPRAASSASGTNAPGQFGVATAAAAGAAATAGRLRANRLTPEEFALVDRFLQRRTALDWHVRESTAREVATRVRQRLDLPPGGVDEELLEQVVTEYRAFGSYR